jgi:osmotically inducible lipoprotein OsmB
MNKIIVISTLVATVALAGCQSTGPNQAIGTGVGAVGGYAIGRSLGGGAAGSALGAVAGAVIGSEVGRGLDQQTPGYPVYSPYPVYRERVIVQQRPVYYDRNRHVERCDIVRQWDPRFGSYRNIRVCR